MSLLLLLLRLQFIKFGSKWSLKFLKASNRAENQKIPKIKSKTSKGFQRFLYKKHKYLLKLENYRKSKSSLRKLNQTFQNVNFKPLNRNSTNFYE